MPRLITAATLILVAGSMVAPSAQAEPEVTEQQIEALFEEAGAMNEEVNAITESVDKVQAEISGISGDISAKQKVADRHRSALAQLTVQEQLDSPMGATASLLASGDSEEFLEGLSAVELLNSSRMNALREYRTSSAKLKSRRGDLAERRTELAKEQKAAIAKRKALTAKYKEAKAELARLSAPKRQAFNTSNTKVDFNVDASGVAKKAIDFAMSQLGDPYVYGGTGPDGWDCSGLVQGSFRAAGVELPRVVGPQMSAVRRVPMSQIQPGDIVAYGNMAHNGIYLGGGRVIHSPRPGKTVEITTYISDFTVAGRVG